MPKKEDLKTIQSTKEALDEFFEEISRAQDGFEWGNKFKKFTAKDSMERNNFEQSKVVKISDLNAEAPEFSPSQVLVEQLEKQKGNNGRSTNN